MMVVKALRGLRTVFFAMIFLFFVLPVLWFRSWRKKEPLTLDWIDEKDYK